MSRGSTIGDLLGESRIGDLLEEEEVKIDPDKRDELSRLRAELAEARGKIGAMRMTILAIHRQLGDILNFQGDDNLQLDELLATEVDKANYY